MDKIITKVAFSRYHQRVLVEALHRARPKTTDRDLNDAWVNMCKEVGATIREQGGQFDMGTWLDKCYYG